MIKIKNIICKLSALSLKEGLGIGFLLFALPVQAQHISGEVYGGGHYGKVSGNTTVAVTTGELGQKKWVGTPMGGVFGAGEGDSAIVSGNTKVDVSGGLFRNSIYGGGKRAKLLGNTNVEITGGTIHVNVYGGARMADIQGYTYVYVHDSTYTESSPVLGGVYGGNDIAGDVMNSSSGGERIAPAFYTALPDSVKPSTIPTSFVRISQQNAEKQPYIGSLFGGSDGSYTYVPTSSGYNVTLLKDALDEGAGTEVISVGVKPVLDRTYLEFQGGTVGNMFAGGDGVTVTDEAHIHLASNQLSKAATIDTTCFRGADAFLTEFEADNYDITGNKATFKYQINRCFGGNNVANMSIRPDWYLVSAHVNNLYSGGNQGKMTYPNGILIAVDGKDMIVHNVFGGGRLADVHPSKGVIDAETINGFDFPAGYSARVLIKGGKIYNVYGGNDVSGQVYNGANVVIRSSIIENVYGSGNGSYAYYSSDKYKESDYFFQTNGETGVQALERLNAHRPNTENVLVDIAGTDAKTTFIAGNVFCGGNSATLRDISGNLEYARAKIKIGSHVVVNGVFLGSNGEQMLNDDVIIGMNSDDHNLVINLKNHDEMEEYMKAVEVAIKPVVEFADDYVPYSTSIGSFYCGGNKGSMSADGTFKIDFLKEIHIFDKLVAGSNDANVTYKSGSANPLADHSYALGGLTSHADPKVLLTVNGLKLEPKKITYDAEEGTFSFDWNRYLGDKATEGDMASYIGYLHGGNIYGGCYSSGYVNGGVQIDLTESVFTSDLEQELNTPFTCKGKTYNYGWDEHLFEPFVSTLTCYGGGYGKETEIWGDTHINIVDNARILKVRGGGELGWVGKMKRDTDTGEILSEPKDTAIWYNSYAYNDSTKIYLIEKKQVEQAYDATVHLNANIIKLSSDPSKIQNNVAEMVAGGFAGIVTGNTHALVDNGCVYTVFGGASNAHIYGNAETLIGEKGFPYVTQTVYGGNDFGGQIMGTKVYETKNKAEGSIQKVKCNSYVEYFQGEIGYNTGELLHLDSLSSAFGIFGGGYGEYDYRTNDDPIYKTDDQGNFVLDSSGNKIIIGSNDNKYYGKATSQPNLLGKIEITDAEADFASNTFVNISSPSTESKDKVMRIYGGGQGFAGSNGVANTRQTYLLLNAANADTRGKNYLAQYVFGAGDCATTWYSRLDAYSGTSRHIFGACRGVSYGQEYGASEAMEETKSRKGIKATAGSKTMGMSQNLSYMGEYSVMNVYPSMKAPEMDVFASGAFSGTKQTYLNLYGGHVAEVYGASYKEGVTYLTEVNVPEGSTIHCKAIYGGGKGVTEEYPCDTYLTTIKYHSADAVVDSAIYGGNRDYRFTRRTMIQVNVPVKNSLGELVDVFGAGKGANTISEISFVNLQDGAQVRNVYGGGDEGLVYNKPSVIWYMLNKDYYRESYTDGTDTTSYCLGDCEIGGFNIWKNQKGIAERVLFPGSGYDLTIGTLAPLKMSWAAEQYEFNTDVHIQHGAVVAENVYGGGYGKKATTAGCAGIHLNGGTVLGNIYGGGYGGYVKDTLKIAGTILKDPLGKEVVGPMVMNNHTKVYLKGGTCTNSFGSGLNGDVIGNTYTFVGRESCDTTEVSYLDGDPAISRSLYGGGEQGAVEDTAYVYMYNGHIGYKYDEDTKDYVMNIDFQTPTDSILYNNGNVFGGGYGEGANAIHTKVYFQDGIIRNSLYGGGEIATVGRGTVRKTDANSIPEFESITKPGETHVYMYGGHVLRDVFGGGRGYSYDLKGNEIIGTRFYSDGYVFGSTDVNIYRGEVGTADQRSLDLGYGNVFGGGNVGFVYSNKTKNAGYYYEEDGKTLSSDCSVLISPATMVTDDEGVTIHGIQYSKCSYIPTDSLNYLQGKLTEDQELWDKMDYTTGVVVHNAVFAGGNVTRGDSKLYADTKTVYGNASATLNDIYNRDLITIGTEHIGGIYGDGNLTTVDGFREICVTNFGTDYYSLSTKITEEEYNALNNRERAYFQYLYECQDDHGGYDAGETIKKEIYLAMSADEQTHWKAAGFCSVYAGRLLNTIQRADLVGVHGSRVVLQGAQDRTVSVVDYTEYAVNRVGELSLNQQKSLIDVKVDSLATHGNYFGFYNTVNYLEALTSDVDFYSPRTTTNTTREGDNYGTTTYYEYKLANKDKTWRDNGTSPNVVALNSGVYLEVVSQASTDSTKVYGPITGVVQLELMNTGDNLGGAFVYAQNIHGKRTGSMDVQKYISPYNKNCATYSGWEYEPTTDDETIETSGNFVHPTKPIVDDCYPSSTDVTSPGHYWFLRGSIYLYDQYISAYTGASTAYKADVQIPLTITAGTHGRLKILDIQPNLYAYYADTDLNTKLTADGDGVVVNGVKYNLNDVVTYWDWSQMSEIEQKMFVRDTYIAVKDFSYGGVNVSKNDVMLSSEYAALPATVTTADGEVDKSEAVHISNATSHSNGYALTADITNPAEWYDRYVNRTDASDIIKKEQYDALSSEAKKSYFVGPSYHAEAGVYGQSQYEVGDIINDEIHGAYTSITETLENQAKVEPVYITTGEISYQYEDVNKYVSAGTRMSETEYKEAIKVAGNSDRIDEAYVCNSTWRSANGNDYVITGELIAFAKYNQLSDTDKTKFSKAWICTEAGLYGGAEYSSSINYDALKGWCDLTAKDREKFSFNYDALDLFINDLDPEAKISDYDKDKNNPYYDREIEVDYKAIATTNVTYKDATSATVTINKGDTLTREQFEAVPNENINYAYIANPINNITYVVREYFIQGVTPYSSGTELTQEEYNKITTENKKYIDKLNFSGLTGSDYYYCKKAYRAGKYGSLDGYDSEVTDVIGSKMTYQTGDSVPVGVLISSEDFASLPNLQNEFNIKGVCPTEISTLYVARDADIEDVIKDRVITLIYQYQYDEAAEGNKMETVTERHVINIHLVFRNGAPSIGRLKVPGAVIPGTSVGLKQPSVTKGAYEILGGGWELYNNEADADNHVNGQPYTNNSSILYFYQTGQYVTYYAKTYMGKTYSNPVPLTVANYHTINDVMADTEHHMFIDHPDVPRNCKIYIDNDDSQTDPTKSELDLLKDLYDLTLTGELNERIKGCDSLDFVLQADVSPKRPWTPLGDSSKCFGNGGFFHGDGHTITGLDNSLFGNFCGSIYNTGIKGSFSGPGIAQNGQYAANCWVWNDNQAGHTGNAFFGDANPNLYNCYYYESDDATQKYTPIADVAIRKNETAFNNGEVAYDLNKYYLVKRHHDHAAPATATIPYSYWTVNSDNSLQFNTNGRYTKDEALIKVSYIDADLHEQTDTLNYVEYRLWDGDFVNADGEIHTSADERYHFGKYYPIYPDDYIFFGQSLNYGYVNTVSHDAHPVKILRTDANRIQLSNENSNRVFRAIAYNGSMEKHVAHFNVECILPSRYNKEISKTTNTVVKTPEHDGISISMSGSNIETKTDTLTDGTVRTTVTTTEDDLVAQTRTITTEITIGQTVDVYPNLTAIDYTGHKDYGYVEGVQNNIFYTPILDYKTLVGFQNPDQSRNMLVYANSSEDKQGYNVLDAYMFEPELTITNTNYNNVAKVSSAVLSAVNGHLIDGAGGSYSTDRCHFLVDDNNFHCPAPYNMGAGHRMWYQRTPRTFSNGNDGYESIVLPFTATMVSAHEKGEITHFYNNDKNNHEYWLRGFKGYDSETGKLKFYRPMMTASTDAGYDSRYTEIAGTDASAYKVKNSFLYAYYYSANSSYDDNKDAYQQTYYDKERSYDNYVYLKANVPYLMAFPGERFYEFDMSGNFTPSNTFAVIGKLEKQNVSFCSDEGARIDTLHTDDLLTTYDGYTYKGTFQQIDSIELDAENARIITTTGDKFAERHHIYNDSINAVLTVMPPFHAYLLLPPGGDVKDFGISEDADYIVEAHQSDGDLIVTSTDRAIFIENRTGEAVDVRIVNTAGQTIANLTIGAGNSDSHEVPSTGVYMVNRRKILVK